jgi:integrase
VASIRKRPDRPKPWEVLYRDPDGRQRSKSFPRKLDAQRFVTSIEADKLRGTYIDPDVGNVTFGTFAQGWLATQTSDPSTREALATRLRVHLLPTFGPMPLRTIRPSTVQAWLRGRQQACAPSTVRVLLANLSAIFGAAVADGLLATNPCSSSSVRAPRLDPTRVVPWTCEQVAAVVDVMPPRYAALPLPAAGCGLRQGEAFGLDLDAVNFLGRRIVVRQQVKQVHGRLVLAPPKGGRTREVPLPDVVAVALAEHLRLFPAREVVLPWREPDGELRRVNLLFTTRHGTAINRNHYNPYVWKPALREAGVDPSRANGYHALRHHYASVLLDGGVSIRALAEYLGHADPGFTLRTYTHLMPRSEDRTRAVVDAAFGPRVGQALAEGGQDGR